MPQSKLTEYYEPDNSKSNVTLKPTAVNNAQSWKDYLHSWYVYLNPISNTVKKQTQMTDYYCALPPV